MGKDKSEKSSKKEKKESKRSETDGVKKSSKKEKKTKLSDDNVAAAFEEAVKQNGGSSVETKEVVIVKDGEVETAITVKRPVGALVPFAAPLADEKVGKKVLKSVKKAAKNKTLKRGVKEVVKALRKRPAGLPSDAIPGVVILAADISPMDVISHIPVLCEDHNIPYIFVVSRAELGIAGATKRPTSVVMVSKERSGKKKDEKIEGDEEYAETFKELVKVVEKEARSVRV